MKIFRRHLIKLLGFSYFSLIISPYSLLFAARKKIINSNLTAEQKKINT